MPWGEFLVTLITLGQRLDFGCSCSYDWYRIYWKHWYKTYWKQGQTFVFCWYQQHLEEMAKFEEKSRVEINLIFLGWALCKLLGESFWFFRGWNIIHFIIDNDGCNNWKITTAGHLIRTKSSQQNSGTDSERVWRLPSPFAVVLRWCHPDTWLWILPGVHRIQFGFCLSSLSN